MCLILYMFEVFDLFIQKSIWVWFLQSVWLYKPFIAVNSSRLSIQLTRFTFTDLWNLKQQLYKTLSWSCVVLCCCWCIDFSFVFDSKKCVCLFLLMFMLNVCSLKWSRCLESQPLTKSNDMFDLSLSVKPIHTNTKYIQ